MKYETWNCVPAPPEASLLEMILQARGIETPQERAEFLHPERTAFYDPFLLCGMDKAVARIRRALETGEQIAVYGDYDVDGITSTALLTRYFRSLGAPVTAYIPDRVEEGYGLNADAVRQLAAQGIRLIVTVDCGITAVEEVALARELGVDVVVTDHHSCKAELPQAVAVVNPQQPDCNYPFRSLAGVAVAWKLVAALAGARRHEEEQRYLPLVAIGTVADAMPLTGENRAIVAQGLALVQRSEFPGLTQLLHEISADSKPITASTVGFQIAPRINAAGRMGQVMVALELLLTQDTARAELLSKELCALNLQRQQVEQKIFEESVQQAEHFLQEERMALVLAQHGWHQGVIGIVASRLAERYRAPVFIISLAQDGRGKGSCRSFGGFNLFSALGQCNDLLDNFGGHDFAAGFTIDEGQIPAFRRRLNEIAVTRSGGETLAAALAVDALLPDFQSLTLSEVSTLDALEPCGTGNPRPVFAVQNVRLSELRDVGGGKHLRIKAQKYTQAMDGIFFSATAHQYDLSPNALVDLAFTPNINSFNGKTTVQMQLCDIKHAMSRAQQERQLLARFLDGEYLSEQERGALVPHREDFAAVWRYVNKRERCDESERDFIRNVARSAQLAESGAHLLLALKVLDELGLVQAQLERGRVLAIACATGEKVDLSQAPLMRRLRGAEPTPV